MKKNALVTLGLVFLLATAGFGYATTDIDLISSVSSTTEKVTIDEARKTALKKVPGTVDDEFWLEDDDEKITTFVFVIINKEGKKFGVHIDANLGTVTTVEEYE
jgi:uncharacterized membrane protein YkoI